MSSPIIVNWFSLGCYGIAGAFSIQSILSAKSGIQNIFCSIYGSNSLSDRINFVKEKNIFTGFKNFCFGSDSLAERTSKLTNGLEHLALGGICALIGFIAFDKGTLATTHSANIPLPPEDLSWKEQTQAFENLYYEQSMTAIAQKNHLQFSEFWRQYTVDPGCKPLIEETRSHAPSQARKIYDCIFDHFLAEIYQKNYSQSPELLEYFEGYAREKPLAISRSKDGSSLISLSKDNEPEKLKAALAEFTGSYLPSLYKEDLQELLDRQFAPLKDISEKRLEYFKATQMRKRIGPFEIHVDQICDQGYLNNQTLAYQLNEKLCKEYQEYQLQLEQINSCEKKLNTLSPQFQRTDGRSEVFEPAINQVINDYLQHRNVPGYAERNWHLPTELFEFFIEQRKHFAPTTSPNASPGNHKCLS